ncbi:MAG: excinuclease ABC subunit UvrA, partial [Bdellovibrionales bacterium]|nr:excinuclease ABC subunit UvrA [Bdellovibrionales bacterium]
PQMTSRLFSFSSPVGACSTCKGFGNTLEIDVNKVIPNPSLSIGKGALTPFEMPSAREDKKDLLVFCMKNKIDITKPWEKLKAEQQKSVWDGGKQFYGVKGLFDYLETKKYKMHVRVFLSRFKTAKECVECHGTRLRSEVQHILLQKKSIIQASAMTLEELRHFLHGLTLSDSQKKVAQEILKQLLSRLDFLIEVGVNYLTLDRQTRTLSGGEYQRLNLANQLGMGLSQILYVLDEPTVGLHPRDNDRLIGILRKLKTLGNTLVVVEHDQDVIRSSDRVLEIGPGSGTYGGELVFSGPTPEFLKSETSPTAPFLRETGKKTMMEVRPVDLSQYKYKIELTGCTGHNLKDVSVTFPLNRLVTVTGVSGSGKSSLVSQTLVPALSRLLTGEHHDGLPFESINGAEHIKNLVFVDQNAVGRSARSSPVTYMKVYDDIRNLMAASSLSKERGYTAGHFSLNVDGGRCPVCKGEGSETVDMVFMDDVKLTCEECRGKKFRDEILEVQFQGKNIDQILNLTVSEAMQFFQNYQTIRRALNFLKEVGLDYIRLGQPSSTLSGGESQRLKLAKEFASAQQRGVLYILDEPTTGLHFKEVNMLLNVLNKLIEAGGSVIVIEHNMDIIRNADFLIELGPDGGNAGGQIVFMGPPQNMLLEKYQSVCPTAPYLKRYFGRKNDSSTRQVSL